MYEVFKSFLDVDTWHTNHPCDDERFYKALSKVVDDSNFNPDDMAEYMISHKGLDSAEDDHPLLQRIRQLQNAADHIADYKKATEG